MAMSSAWHVQAGIAAQSKATAGKVDRAVLTGSAYLSSRAAQQLLENHLVRRGARCVFHKACQQSVSWSGHLANGDVSSSSGAQLITFVAVSRFFFLAGKRFPALVPHKASQCLVDAFVLGL